MVSLLCTTTYVLPEVLDLYTESFNWTGLLIILTLLTQINGLYIYYVV